MRSLGLAETGWRGFRRAVATALSELREPVKTAQAALEHSSPTTTLGIYAQSVEESERSTMVKLEALMFPDKLAGRQGFEPRYADPESAYLI